MEKRVTESALETQAFAKEIAKTVKTGDIIALYGDLGSGKTTFVQGLAKGLGISKRIISPTFIIMRTYVLEGDNIKVLHHLDLYRLRDEKDTEGLGLKEIMEDNDSIVVIEWPEKIEKLLPKRTKRMHFTYRNDNEREIVYGH